MSASTTQAAVSARRLAANQANARKSTGPRTEAGKRTSSQNARKTPPCPFTFELPRHFADEWFHDALRRTAACTDTRARLLLINRCMLQAHELRWAALERTLFDVALDESGGCVEVASLWLAQQVAAAKGLTAYHRWIAHRINLVERSLAALAAQSASVEAEAPKTMAAGAGAGSTFSELSPSDLGPDSTLPISYSDSGWSFGAVTGLFTYRVGAPQPPQPPKPPKPPTIGPIRGRYRLYLRCPAAPESPNEAMTPARSVSTQPEANQLPQQPKPLPEPAHLPQQSKPLPAPVHLPQQPKPLPDPLNLSQQSKPLPDPVNFPQQSTLLPQPAQLPEQSKPLSDPVHLSQQSKPYPQHSLGHCPRPIPTTTTPESNQQQLTSDQQLAIDLDGQMAEPKPRPNHPNLPQQPKPLPQHSPQHCWGPIPTTTTPDQTQTKPQPSIQPERCPKPQPATNLSRNTPKRSQTAVSAVGVRHRPPVQSSETHPNGNPPNEPVRPPESPHTPEAAYRPPP
jgi:hypothetical protein